jgi:serine/threonine protein phosphatase PrpC
MVRADDCLAIVADGLGGHRGGREASRLAVREFVARYRTLAARQDTHSAAREALATVNQLIHARGSADSTLAQMGTTFTALILRGSQGHIVHIGDTRAYRLRAGQLEQLTHDHNLAVMGRPNVLYRALGTDTAMEADHEECTTQIHDRFLLCSDGVHGVLPDAALTALLGRSENLQACAEHIIEAALRAGSQDNVTAVVVEIAGKM